MCLLADAYVVIKNDTAATLLVQLRLGGGFVAWGVVRPHSSIILEGSNVHRLWYTATAKFYTGDNEPTVGFAIWLQKPLQSMLVRELMSLQCMF